MIKKAGNDKTDSSDPATKRKNHIGILMKEATLKIIEDLIHFCRKKQQNITSPKTEQINEMLLAFTSIFFLFFM